jgi:hypothetical protein
MPSSFYRGRDIACSSLASRSSFSRHCRVLRCPTSRCRTLVVPCFSGVLLISVGLLWPHFVWLQLRHASPLLVSGVFEFGNDHRVFIGWSCGELALRSCRWRQEAHTGANFKRPRSDRLLRRAHGHHVGCVDFLGLAHETGTVSSGSRLPT